MPRYPIERSTNFIIEDESWSVIEYDHTSVPGTIYLSLTENKINSIYDDLENNIADTDKLADYQVSAPAETQQFTIGAEIKPTFTLTKNGIPFEAEVTLLPADKSMIKNTNGVLTGRKVGDTQVIVQLTQYPTIYTTVDIAITDGDIDMFSAYIEGPATIRLDRDATYVLRGTQEIAGEVTYSINTDLVILTSIDNISCSIHANNKNNLGSFILTATYDGVDYTKDITIIPLW